MCDCNSVTGYLQHHQKIEKKVLLVDVSVEEKKLVIFSLNIDISVERTIYNMVRAELQHGVCKLCKTH
jgi:hypothetical protein